MTMNTPDNDPAQQDIESLVTDEERRALLDPNVPDEVKTEIAERLARFGDRDLEQIRAEDGGNPPC